MTSNNTEVAVLGGGCFWCIEAVFTEIRGVTGVESGYAGGQKENPTYYEVCSGRTGHAEVVKVEFDPGQVTFPEVLEVFFASHDPTTLNRQGADVGTQYRSVILHTSDEQKAQAADFIKALDESREFSAPVVTEIAPLEVFYPAEAEHYRFYERNPGSMYCRIVIDPKITKVRQKFASKLG